jgi:hypothetical protein
VAFLTRFPRGRQVILPSWGGVDGGPLSRVRDSGYRPLRWHPKRCYCTVLIARATPLCVDDVLPTCVRAGLLSQTTVIDTVEGWCGRSPQWGTILSVWSQMLNLHPPWSQLGEWPLASCSRITSGEPLFRLCGGTPRVSIRAVARCRPCPLAFSLRDGAHQSSWVKDQDWEGRPMDEHRRCGPNQATAHRPFTEWRMLRSLKTNSPRDQVPQYCGTSLNFQGQPTPFEVKARREYLPPCGANPHEGRAAPLGDRQTGPGGLRQWTACTHALA